MITCTYQRCMAGVEIVVGEISGGEDVVPTTDLGDENAIPRFSSETSSLSELDAVFIGNLIIVRTRCLFVGFGIMGHLVLEWQSKCLRRTQMLSLRSESWRPWRAEWKCVPYVGDRAKDARDLPNANPNSITQGDDDLGYVWLDPLHMAHIFAWHDTAVTNPTTEKIENKGFTSLWWNYSYLPEMYCRSWNCRRRRRRPRRWPWCHWPLCCWPLHCWPLGRGSRHHSNVRCHRQIWWLIMKALADSLFSYCFVVIIIVTGKQTNFGREKRTFRTVGWGEYGTAGVKTAPLYLSNGSPERDKFILKVDLKIQIKGTLWSNIFLHDIPFLR